MPIFPNQLIDEIQTKLKRVVTSTPAEIKIEGDKLTYSGSELNAKDAFKTWGKESAHKELQRRGVRLQAHVQIVIDKNTTAIHPLAEGDDTTNFTWQFRRPSHSRMQIAQAEWSDIDKPHFNLPGDTYTFAIRLGFKTENRGTVPISNIITGLDLKKVQKYMLKTKRFASSIDKKDDALASAHLALLTREARDLMGNNLVHAPHFIKRIRKQKFVLEFIRNGEWDRTSQIPEKLAVLLDPSFRKHKLIDTKEQELLEAGVWRPSKFLNLYDVAFKIQEPPEAPPDEEKEEEAPAEEAPALAEEAPAPAEEAAAPAEEAAAPAEEAAAPAEEAAAPAEEEAAPAEEAAAPAEEAAAPTNLLKKYLDEIEQLRNLGVIAKNDFIKRLSNARGQFEGDEFQKRAQEILEEANSADTALLNLSDSEGPLLKPLKEDWNTKYLEKRGFASSEDEPEVVQEAPRSSWATSSNTSLSEKEMVHVDDAWADDTSGNESAFEESTSKDIRALWASTSSGTDVTSSGTDELVWASQSETDDDKLDTMIAQLEQTPNAAWASEEDE